MPDQPAFELRIVEALTPFAGGDAESLGHPGSARHAITPKHVADALRATKGSSAVLGRFPQLGRPETWLDTAFFSLCAQHGSVITWNLLGVESLAGCRAFFGEAVPNTDIPLDGRLDLEFRAPTAGVYTMTVRLDSPGAATVECLVDGTSFGPLAFQGPKLQPHVAVLGTGRHRFQIRQRSGAFAFLSMSVWTPPVATQH